MLPKSYDAILNDELSLRMSGDSVIKVLFRGTNVIGHNIEAVFCLADVRWPSVNTLGTLDDPLHTTLRWAGHLIPINSIRKLVAWMRLVGHKLYLLDGYYYLGTGRLERSSPDGQLFDKLLQHERGAIIGFNPPFNSNSNFTVQGSEILYRDNPTGINVTEGNVHLLRRIVVTQLQYEGTTLTPTEHIELFRKIETMIQEIVRAK